MTEDSKGSLREDAIIAAPHTRVRQALLDVAAWPRLLPWVHGVRCVYEDSRYQEFMIDLDVAGRPASVRSVRRCAPDHIAFFFPDHASFLKHHCGTWSIRALTPDTTCLTSAQDWVVSAKAELVFPARGGLSSGQLVSASLHRHARMTLAAWQLSLSGDVG